MIPRLSIVAVSGLLLVSVAGGAQGADLSIIIPELPAGKSLTFSYEGEVADPFATLDAATVSQQLFVTADGDVTAESLIVSARLDNPPVLDLNGSEEGTDYSTAFVQLDGPVALTAPDAVIGQRASEYLDYLKITVSPMPNGSSELIDADVSGTPGITKSYDPVAGILMLAGTDTVANYQQVLRTVVYDNGAGSMDLTDRTGVFVASDDFSESVPGVTVFTVETGSAGVVDWSTY